MTWPISELQNSTANLKYLAARRKTFEACNLLVAVNFLFAFGLSVIAFWLPEGNSELDEVLAIVSLIYTVFQAGFINPKIAKTSRRNAALQEKFDCNLFDIAQNPHFASDLSQVSAGKLPSDEGSYHLTVDATEGRRIAAAIHRAVYLKELPAVLGTTRNVATQLLDERILHPIADRSSKTRGHTSKAVDRQEVDDFLKRISALAREVLEVPEGFVPLIKAAEKVKARTSDIIHLLLAGALKHAVRVSGEAGIGALRFDPEKLKPLVHQIEGKGLAPSEAFGLLRMPVETGWDLLETCGSGLKVTQVSSRTDHMIPRVPARRVKAFSKKYSSVPEYAESLNVGGPTLGRALKARGIKPAFSWSEFGADIYRRSDLEGFRPGWQFQS